MGYSISISHHRTVSSSGTNHVSTQTGCPDSAVYVTFGKYPGISTPAPQETSMRSLFTVFIVNPKTDTIVFEANIIAADTRSAERKAIQMAGDKITADMDDYDFVVEMRGNRDSIRSKSND